MLSDFNITPAIFFLQFNLFASNTDETKIVVHLFFLIRNNFVLTLKIVSWVQQVCILNLGGCTRNRLITYREQTNSSRLSTDHHNFIYRTKKQNKITWPPQIQTYRRSWNQISDNPLSSQWPSDSMLITWLVASASHVNY